MESFVFEQNVLFSTDFLSVTSDYRVQCPRWGWGQNLGHLRFFFSNKTVFMSFSDTQCLFLVVALLVQISTVSSFT